MKGERPLTKPELRKGKMDREQYHTLPRLPLVLILDSLKSAHNVGTILRLAEAVRAEKVYICGNTLIPPNKKIKTSSKGAERWVPWEYLPTTLEAIEKVKISGFKVLSVELSETSKLYTEVDFSNYPQAYVLGREYDGVSPEVLNASDAIVHLPMYGMANSINVSCAAAAIVYHAVECMRQKTPPHEGEGVPVER